MQDRALYSIQESRKLLGGISRNTIYHLLRTGQLASVLIGWGSQFDRGAGGRERQLQGMAAIAGRGSMPRIAPLVFSELLGTNDEPCQFMLGR